MTRNRILIVDDSTVNVKLIRVLLELKGFETATASDAVEAQRQMDAQCPDVVLMDLQLPAMDGLTLTRLLKADPRFKQVLIVALTAYAMKGDRERAFDAGCDGYLTKPIDTRTFAESIRQLLSAHADTSTSS